MLVEQLCETAKAHPDVLSGTRHRTVGYHDGSGRKIHRGTHVNFIMQNINF